MREQWLESAVEETDKRGRKTRTTGAKDSRCGIPQGSHFTLTSKFIYAPVCVGMEETWTRATPW